MIAPDREAIDRLTTSAGFGRARLLTPLKGGANNRVYRLNTENGEAVLKAYFRHPDDPRDRLANEFAFTRFAWSCGIRCIPQPLSCDEEAGLGLFELVNGQSFGASEVLNSVVGQASEFVRDLNAQRRRSLASKLPVASEACFSIAEHLGTVARRVMRLSEINEPEVAAFVRDELWTPWASLQKSVEAEVNDDGLSLHRPLELPARCVSPSDFGFHNALLEPTGRVRFLDFEYAGWDDPAKLICDFFCQPAVPVHWRFFDVFANAVAECFRNPKQTVIRARLLLPVYRMKWVCIRLNEFLPTSSGRRVFSLNADEMEARKARQLATARMALAAIRDREEAFA